MILYVHMLDIVFLFNIAGKVELLSGDPWRLQASRKLKQYFGESLAQDAAGRGHASGPLEKKMCVIHKESIVMFHQVTQNSKD